MRRYRTLLLMFALIPIASCARDRDTGDGDRDTADSAVPVTCTAVQRVDTLPSVINEASGIAASHSLPGLLWVHNDNAGTPALFALDTLGQLRARVRLDTHIRSTDLEDIAVAECATGHCIYLADVGDNFSARDHVRLLRIPEPASLDDSIVTAEFFPFRYPDGPHDAEALFVLPGERVFVITKGRNGPVALFRYPGSLRPDTVTLLHVRDLTAGLVQLPDMVTGASASADGKTVAVRTYAFLRFYRPDGDDLKILPPDSFPLVDAAEFQGEGVTLAAGGRVFLVGERSSLDNLAPPLSSLVCH